MFPLGSSGLNCIIRSFAGFYQKKNVIGMQIRENARLSCL